MIEKENCRKIAKLSYLAGIVDGEGTIMIQRYKDGGGYGLILSIGNSNFEVLQWIQERYGGNIVGPTHVNEGNRKPMYTWALYGENARRLIKKLIGTLIIKKLQAEIAEEFWIKYSTLSKHYTRSRRPKWLVERGRGYHEQMRQANHR